MEVAEASRKQPPESWIPLPKVDVPLPTVRLLATLKVVVVALVPVALVNVKVVKLARVANRSVEVACVMSAFAPVSVPTTLKLVEVAPVNTPLVV